MNKPARRCHCVMRRHGPLVPERTVALKLSFFIQKKINYLLQDRKR